MRSKYGITFERAREILEVEQQGRCAICLSESPRARRNGWGWCVDHDHKTSKVRGILCHPCNSAIGLLREDETTLKAAIDYLARARATEPAQS